ncbi:MAG: redoxin domain-containing protein [Pedobacter sp.]|nr:redoxin domain-containing protein [Pedobacter sp.]MDQ8052103.1 redoxin domain-containing protein [Pedobacter sp.]
MRRFIFTICLLASLAAVTRAQKALTVGKVLPNLALINTSGNLYELNAQKNVKGFILVFMTPTCDHCRAYESRIVALDKKYKVKGFPIVAIGPYGDDPIKYPLDALPEMKKLAIERGFKFPYLSDDHFKYTWMLGIKTTPTAVVLQKQSNGYLIKYIGRIDDEQNEKLKPKNKFVEQVVDKMVHW